VRAGPLEQAANELARQCLARMRGTNGAPPAKPDDLSFILFRRHAPSRSSSST
jgi:hypothetical protein